MVCMQGYLAGKMFSLKALNQRLMQRNDVIVDDTSLGACYTRCKAGGKSSLSSREFVI